LLLLLLLLLRMGDMGQHVLPFLYHTAEKEALASMTSTTSTTGCRRIIDSLTANMRPYIGTIFRNMDEACPEDASVLGDFIIAEQNEMNIADSTKEWKN
jgi:hypothetical protein